RHSDEVAAEPERVCAGAACKEDGLMASIYDWSKTASSNSNADSGINWAEGMDPGAVNDSARQEMARIAECRDDITGTITAGGTANALTVTANSGFTTLANGRMVAFI